MIANFQQFVAAFPDWLQWVAIVLISAVPFVESYLGSVIGIVIGVNPVVATIAAIAGNIASMLAVVLVVGAVRKRAGRRGDGSVPSPKRARVRQLFERFGVPGVSLFGHPTQISSAAMIGFGAPRRAVIAWQCVSITLWGAIVATLATVGESALAH
ncbi:membrane protein [Streptomyces sp. 150FB]|uniref:hypothetical protein n=1 Tax=Streptomyces sp. 150FB TaxID=1576605 RepID=UPI0005890855|nr:hypothetical protein [Streptomyces sp. 150FB]KIF72898.1 membrane protein [Streptomyces sp. 150FB]